MFSNHGTRRVWRGLVAALGLALALPVSPLASFAADPPSSASKAALEGVVNVNAANLDELQLLPGVGEARAKAIIAERTQRGGFKSVDELVEVKGIGDTLLAQLRPFVRLDGKTTAQVR